MAATMTTVSTRFTRARVHARGAGRRRRFVGITTRPSASSNDTTTTTTTTEEDASDDSRTSSSSTTTRDAFSSFERALAEAARMGAESSSARGWEKVGDAYVARPANGGEIKRVVHFCGGAFVGASPQVTYGYFLESMVERSGALVIATPVQLGLDHLRVADETWHKYERCVRTLRKEIPDFDELPVYGVGHSLGALITTLIGSRYETRRDGNVLISFNNRPATDAIPLFAELFVPGLRGLSPIIDAANKSPFRTMSRNADAQLREFAPPLVKELLPILDNLEPVILEIADGRAEFTPTPQESAKLVQKYYAVKRNLLVKFTDDSIDETSAIAATLAGAAAAEDIDLTVRTRQGDHVFPLWRDTGIEVPDEIYEVAEQGGEMLAAFGDAFGLKADGSPLGLLRESFDNMRTQARDARAAPGLDENKQRMRALVDEITDWMDIRA